MPADALVRPSQDRRMRRKQLHWLR
jgi:hypothetical protein